MGVTSGHIQGRTFRGASVYKVLMAYEPCAEEVRPPSASDHLSHPIDLPVHAQRPAPSGAQTATPRSRASPESVCHTPIARRMVYTSPSVEEPMSRTNIVLDTELVDKAMRLTGARSKREVVDIALRRLVEKGELYRAIRRLQGGLEWEGDVRSWRSARTSR